MRVPPPDGEGADVDFVELGQLEQQRRGHRPLVALEMVQIARADRQARRHVGLRQFMVAAQAAQAMAEEELAGHDRKFCQFRPSITSQVVTSARFLPVRFGGSRVESAAYTSAFAAEQRHDKF